jgi:putative sigma-54 modulation protein
MNIDIRWKRAQKSKAIEDHARRRAGFALDRFAERIRHVSLRFEDLNGPRGGVDKRCTVEAQGQFAPVVVSADAESYFQGVSRALKALERALARSVERQHA